MGGVGSGRHYRWNSKDTCEAYRRIDLAYLRKTNRLFPGSWGSLSWTCGDEPSGSIVYRVHEGSLQLIYKVREFGDDKWCDVDEYIPFAFTRPHLGGRRCYFVCPCCAHKCSILYGGRYFRCRKCYNLAYQSQQETPLYRALSQAQKLRRRLGGSECIDDPFPEKPKGMHWKTYERLYRRGADLEHWIAIEEVRRFGIIW